MVEAWTCTMALRFAIDLGLRRIVLEGDSLSVIKKLQNHTIDRSLIGPLIEEEFTLVVQKL